MMGASMLRLYLDPRLLQRPLVSPVRVTVAMRRKKAAAMFPEPRPDAFPVRLRQLQPGQRLSRKELKSPLAMRRRQVPQPPLHLEQKHQPMALSLIPMLAHQTREVHV